MSCKTGYFGEASSVLIVLNDDVEQEKRELALAKPLDMPVLTVNIQKQIKETDALIAQLETATGQLQADKEQLAIKVDKKKQELNRAQKRLQSLSDVRYPFIFCLVVVRFA